MEFSKASIFRKSTKLFEYTSHATLWYALVNNNNTYTGYIVWNLYVDEIEDNFYQQFVHILKINLFDVEI